MGKELYKKLIILQHLLPKLNFNLQDKSNKEKIF